MVCPRCDPVIGGGTTQIWGHALKKCPALRAGVCAPNFKTVSAPMVTPHHKGRAPPHAVCPKFLGPLLTFIRFDLTWPNSVYSNICGKEVFPVNQPRRPFQGHRSQVFLRPLRTYTYAGKDVTQHDDQIRWQEIFYMVDHGCGQTFFDKNADVRSVCGS